MNNHAMNTPLWVPNTSVVLHTQTIPAPPTGLTAEREIILQRAAAAVAADRPARRRHRPVSVWSRLRARHAHLPT